jgi:hypothetical protein
MTKLSLRGLQRAPLKNNPRLSRRAYASPSRPAQGVDLETFLYRGRAAGRVHVPQRTARLSEARRAHPVRVREGETP